MFPGLSTLPTDAAVRVLEHAYERNIRMWSGEHFRIYSELHTLTLKVAYITEQRKEVRFIYLRRTSIVTQSIAKTHSFTSRDASTSRPEDRVAIQNI